MSDHPDKAHAAPAQRIQDLPYRPAVGIMLLNRHGKVFVAQRIDMPSAAWQMPQGGIDKGESPLAAARRELKEEIGTDKAELIAESREWYSYDLPADLVPKLWRGRYRGQTQKWFVFRFLGRNKDVDIATENPEFSDWKWADMTDLPNLIVPFKRALYAQLIDEFERFAADKPSAR